MDLAVGTMVVPASVSATAASRHDRRFRLGTTAFQDIAPHTDHEVTTTITRHRWCDIATTTIFSRDIGTIIEAVIDFIDNRH